MRDFTKHPIANFRNFTMANAAMRILAVLVLQILCLRTAHAAGQDGPQFGAEISKQEQIYRSGTEQLPEGYIIDRSLLSYVHTLSPGFDRALAALGPQDRWLDVGAGRGQAVLDYYASRFDEMYPKAARTAAARPGQSPCRSKIEGRPFGSRQPPVSAQIKFDICPAAACANIRSKNSDGSSSLPM